MPPLTNLWLARNWELTQGIDTFFQLGERLESEPSLVISFAGNCTDHFLSDAESDLGGNDDEYFRFGKQVHRKYLGFGTMGSAFFARGMIDDALVQAANEDRSEKSLAHLKEMVGKHR